MKEELKQSFIKSFPIKGKFKNKPYIILYDAFTGMGKSTVSKLIQKYDNSVIINNDEIRNWLNDYSDETNSKTILQKYRLERLIENNISCIVDSCFSHNWKEKKKYYDELGIKYYVIRLVCDELIIEERLNKRILNNDNYSIANYNDYLWMKDNVEKVDDDLIDFTIDTTLDIEEQVRIFISKYNIEC